MRILHLGQSVGRTLLALLPAVFLVLRAAAATVTVTPSQPAVRAEATRQFNARQTGACAPVTWHVNGIPGGNAVVGTITPNGLYTAPPVNPGVPVTIRASIAIPPTAGETAVRWQNPTPALTSINPGTVNVGTFRIQVTGRGFVPGSIVQFNGVDVPTAVLSPNLVEFQATLDTPGSYPIRVLNPEPGPATSGSKTLRVLAPVTVTVYPTTRSIRLGASKQFSASVANTTNKLVTWWVNEFQGGSPELGQIAADGTYTAPPAMPTIPVLVRAVSIADPRASGASSLTFQNPIPVLTGASPTPLLHGTRTFLLVGTGFVPGSIARLGEKPIETTYVSPTQLSVTATIDPVVGGRITFRVRNPDPSASTSGTLVVPTATPDARITHLAAARFLEQASFGPTPATVARLQQVGFEAWIDEQLALPRSTYRASTSSADSLTRQQSEFFANALRNPDQLRQRVAFALSQIFVVSGVKTGQPRQMVPYLNMLLEDAFGPYSQVLRDVTLSPTMGVFLDMVNNDRANAATGAVPNENYAREVAQLFSIGTILLNPDGSAVRNPSGNPIPTYVQADILETARALTGWTFPGRAITSGHNRESYAGPMIPVEANHDTGSKRIIGGRFIPAGQTATEDLAAVLESLATHPNVAPFISLRLIQQLVLSNPSPGYIGRISAVFNTSGGNLGTVVRAILLDPEARAGDDPANPLPAAGGHLRQPVLYLTDLMRALDATINDNNPVEAIAAEAGQKPFYAPSVFNYFSPLYRLPDGLLAPEFQTLNSSTALVRANAVESLVSRNLDGNARINLTHLRALAAFPDQLVDAVDHALLYGRLPGELKSRIITAITATSDNNQRVRNAIYLVATSSLYQVEH